MAEADRLAIAGGTPGIRLMENAGRAVADAVTRGIRRRVRCCVVAGPGNNGGDGFVCARILAERGYPVRLLLLGERDRLKGDAAEARGAGAGRSSRRRPAALAGAELIVDALFGAGLDRPVERRGARDDRGDQRRGRAGPRGRSAERHQRHSGAVMGAAVQASETVTFFRRKPGHVLLPGRLHCGPVEVADIGIPDRVLASIAPRIFANAPALWADRFPVPQPGGHKYRRGHAVVVSGDQSHTGAARLAARGALRAGAGLVTHRKPARRARRQCRGKPRRHGAAGRWRGRALPACSPTRGSTPSCSAPAAASGRRCATWCWRRSPANGRWCSTPTR